jgi:hypothetical protein
MTLKPAINQSRSDSSSPECAPRAGHVPTSLDPQETPAQEAHYPTQRDVTTYPELTINWRHTCWHRDRERVYNALSSCIASDSRLERFASCGTDAWVMQDPANPERLRVTAAYCHDRWCVPCGRAKARIIAGNLRAHIGDRPHRFITLTLRANNEPLTNRITTLYAAFRALRRNTAWAKRIRGGAAFCEPVWSERSGSWHVHLHVIADGQFIPQQELSDAWLHVTGDSYVVDIRLIHGHDQAVDYVTKYASKPLHPATVRDNSRLQEAIVALRGRRLVLPFGTWHGIRLSTVNDATEWIALAPLGEILQRAASGDAWADAVLRILRGVQSCHQLDLPLEPP